MNWMKASSTVAIVTAMFVGFKGMWLRPFLTASLSPRCWIILTSIVRTCTCTLARTVDSSLVCESRNLENRCTFKHMHSSLVSSKWINEIFLKTIAGLYKTAARLSWYHHANLISSTLGTKCSKPKLIKHAIKIFLRLIHSKARQG